MGYGEFVQKLRKRYARMHPDLLSKYTGSPLERERKAFGKAAGVHWVTIAKWETGGTAPRKANLEKMLKTAGLTLEECLFLPEEIVHEDQLVKKAESIMRDVAERLTAESRASPEKKPVAGK